MSCCVSLNDPAQEIQEPPGMQIIELSVFWFIYILKATSGSCCGEKWGSDKTGLKVFCFLWEEWRQLHIYWGKMVTELLYWVRPKAPPVKQFVSPKSKSNALWGLTSRIKWSAEEKQQWLIAGFLSYLWESFNILPMASWELKRILQGADPEV